MRKHVCAEHHQGAPGYLTNARCGAKRLEIGLA